jgi:hypothetical protein
VASVKVTAGSVATTGWAATVVLPAGSAIASTWEARPDGSTGTVGFTNLSYNGRLGPGQSVTFGFLGSGSATGLAASSCAAS